MEPSGHQRGATRAVEVRRRDGDKMSGFVREEVRGEVHFAVVVEDHERGRLGLPPVVEGTHGHHVDCTVAVEIDADRTEGAGEIADAVASEITVANIFQPLHPVPGPRPRLGVVKAVAIRVEDIRSPVAI